MTEKQTEVNVLEPRCRRSILDLYPVAWIYSLSFIREAKLSVFSLGGCEEGLHNLAALPCLSPENCAYVAFTVPSKKSGINFW